jgi:hypothetical protein
MYNKFTYILYHEPKIAFANIPKNASGTLKAIAKHWKKDYLSYTCPKNYRCYCIVRNPYERVYSAFMRTMEIGIKVPERLHGYTDYNLFVHNELKYISDPSHEHGNWHYYPMKWFIERCPKDVTILRFENTHKELQEIFGDLIPFKIPNKNKHIHSAPNRAHYRQIYDDESIKIVSQLYKWDIDNLGYTF